MRFEITSKLFGRFDINVDIDEMTSDMWEIMDKFLTINIYQHPVDELDHVPYKESMWIGAIHTLETNWYDGQKVTSYGERIEHTNDITIELKDS